MAKEKDKVELRPVDEDAEARLRYVRLHRDAAEEVEELPPVKVGIVPANARADAAGKDELKIRSNDPDVGSLIEKEAPGAEEPWADQAVVVAAFPWGWVALVAFAFAAAISWSLVSLNRAEEKGRSRAVEAAAAREKEMREEVDAELLIATLERTVRGFFDARSVEEMLKHVRHPDRVGPLMERHYAGTPPEPVRVTGVTGMNPLTIDTFAAYWMVTCELEGGAEGQLLVEALSETEARVDWETFVCYQPMAWDEFARERPGGYSGDFRVYAEKDHFHSHEFSDSAAFESYRLTALNGESVLFGYAPRGSDLARRISELIGAQRGAPAPLILRLHVPQGVSSPNGVVIREIVNSRWVFLEPPAKEEP